MDVIRRQSLARGTALATAVVGHLLWFILLLNTHAQRFRIVEPTPSRSGVLLFLELPPPIQPSPEKSDHKPVRTSQPLTEATAPLHTDATIQIPSPKPRVDWHGEAEEVARKADLAVLALKQSGCDASRRPGSLLPRCKKRAEYHPEPEPKRAGFSGGIPYVRLGKRCIIALGGFGCALGKLPNGRNGKSELFEAMRDPDRPRSSVPDLPDQPQEEAPDTGPGPRLEPR